MKLNKSKKKSKKKVGKGEIKKPENLEVFSSIGYDIELLAKKIEDFIGKKHKDLWEVETYGNDLTIYYIPKKKRFWRKRIKYLQILNGDKVTSYFQIIRDLKEVMFDYLNGYKNPRWIMDYTAGYENLEDYIEEFW